MITPLRWQCPDQGTALLPGGGRQQWQQRYRPLVGETLTLTPDVTLDAVDLSAYSGVALPCMAPTAEAEVPQAVLDLLSEAVDDNLPIAASRGSVAEVGLAGGLKGRNYAYARSPDPRERPEFADGNYLGTGVVRDG